MDIQTWLTFVVASSVLLIIPGPTIILVLSYSLRQGKKVALATAAGVAFGDFIAMTASLLGLGALILVSGTLFAALKLIGALYLIFLGVKLLITPIPKNFETNREYSKDQAKNIFKHAAIVTALNPKSIAFFIAFVPQFVVLDTSVFLQFVILIVTFVALAALNALAYALLADKLRAKINASEVTNWLSNLGGSALIAMGVFTLFLKRT